MMLRAVGFLALIYLIIACGPAGSQIVRQCNGDFTQSIHVAPDDFLVNARIEPHHDFQYAVTCVQQLASGHFRFHWHIPDHRVDLEEAVGHERRRPIAVDTVLTRTLGCFAYGNLTRIGRSDFYADPWQLKQAESERQNDCPKTIASNSVPQALAQQALDKPIVPRELSYRDDVLFYAGEPEKEKGVTSISVRVEFSRDEKSGRVTLLYSAKSPLGLPPPSERELSLRPVGLGMEAGALKDAFQTYFGVEYRLKASDKVSFGYAFDDHKRFGSAQLGVHNKSGEVLSTFWVPVLY